jgi:uncharacterized phage protein gp47/JayE
MAELTWKPVFEEDEATIKERMLQHPDLEGWRKEPGDFVHDPIAAVAPEIKQLQINQDATLKNAFAIFAEGEFLDYKVEEANLERGLPEKAKGKLQVQAAAGVVIPKDYVVSTVVLDNEGNPIQATVDTEVVFTTAGVQEISLTTTGTGQIMNVPAGSEWIFTPPIPGVEVITQPADFTGGRDREGDESLRSRWKDKKRKPIRSGNKHNYVSWALEVPGVGKAKCIPLWNGRGTVKVIIIDTDGRPASPELVAAVQAYIDPDQDGMGNGQCPISAVVTVESAAERQIDVVADVTPNKDKTVADVLEKFNEDLDAYLAGLTFVDPPDGNVIYSKIAGILSANPYLADYTGLTVNGGTSNIVLAGNEIPVRGTVTLT